MKREIERNRTRINSCRQTNSASTVRIVFRVAQARAISNYCGLA